MKVACWGGIKVAWHFYIVVKCGWRRALWSNGRNSKYCLESSYNIQQLYGNFNSILIIYHWFDLLYQNGINFLFFYCNEHLIWTKLSNHGRRIQWPNSINLKPKFDVFFLKDCWKALSTHFATMTLFDSKKLFFAIVAFHFFLNAFLNGLK